MIGRATGLRRGTGGRDVQILQKALATRGFSPGAIDGEFGAATEAAVLAFQRGEGLLADGIVGSRTRSALDLPEGATPIDPLAAATSEVVSRLFPAAMLCDIASNLPVLLRALDRHGLNDSTMVLTSLATVRAGSKGFLPEAEPPTRYNTSPGGRPFDLYDHRRDLGNLGPPDGAMFAGRGYVGLRGRRQYRQYGPRLHSPCDLEQFPILACASDVAADLLALHLLDREMDIRRALLAADLHTAHELVTAEALRSDRFVAAYREGERLLYPAL